MSTTYDGDEERQLRVELMKADLGLKQADLLNKLADTEYKRGLARYEPWKVVLASFTTGAGIMAAIAGILAVILRG